jgi:hypothetical protein
MLAPDFQVTCSSLKLFSESGPWSFKEEDGLSGGVRFPWSPQCSLLGRSCVFLLALPGAPYFSDQDEGRLCTKTA